MEPFAPVPQRCHGAEPFRACPGRADCPGRAGSPGGRRAPPSAGPAPRAGGGSLQRDPGVGASPGTQARLRLLPAPGGSARRHPSAGKFKT